MISLKRSEPKWAKATLSKCGLSLFLFCMSLSASAAVVAPKNSLSQAAAANSLPRRSLSLVTFFDIAEGQVFNWWAENSVPSPMAKTAYAINRFLPADVYIHPNQEKVDIPDELKKTDLTAIEKMRLAKLFNAAVLVTGDVRFSPSPLLPKGTRLKVHLKAQSLRGPTAEIVRVLDLQPTDLPGLTVHAQNPLALLFMELQGQLDKAPGLKADDHIELVVSGKMNFAEWENFKTTLRNQIKGIKNIQEVAFENEQVALQISYLGTDGANALSAALGKMRWVGYRTQVVSHDDERVFFDVKAKAKNKKGVL